MVAVTAQRLQSLHNVEYYCHAHFQVFGSASIYCTTTRLLDESRREGREGVEKYISYELKGEGVRGKSKHCELI